VGVIQQGATATYSGIHVSQSTFDNVFGAPDARRFFVRTTSGTNNIEAARAIESALLTTGAQADSLRKLLDDLTAVQSGFFYLLQGFMGLGLFVGVAAVGVIAFRTVVERRQQIGMLRAIGATRKQVRTVILAEALILSGIGTVFGILTGMYLGYLAVQAIGAAGFPTEYVFPLSGVLLGIAAGIVFGLLAAIIPARQATRLQVVEALRYE